MRQTPPLPTTSIRPLWYAAEILRAERDARDQVLRDGQLALAVEWPDMGKYGEFNRYHNDDGYSGMVRW